MENDEKKTNEPGGTGAPAELFGPPAPAVEGSRAATLPPMGTTALRLSPHGKRIGRPPKHGKYVGKRRKPLSMEEMAGSPASPLLEESQPEIVPLEVSGDDGFDLAIYDKEAQRPYVEMIIRGLVELKGFWRSWKVFRVTKDREFARLVSAKNNLSPELEKVMQESGLEIAAKYQIDLKKTPEGFFIGAFLIWSAEDAKATQEAVAEYLKAHPANGLESPKQ